MAKRVNYDKLRVIFTSDFSEESLRNYYSILIDYQIKTYGKKVVKKALEKVLEKQ